MTFSTTFHLLQNEAFLARGSLSVGLSALRNATFPDKATFYSGFFNTSIGLERVMKLIVVTDHMLHHGHRAPSKEALKAFGHDLMTLYASCVTAATRAGVQDISLPSARTLERELLQFFSEFATHSRYYNLDTLSATTAPHGDPLARWGTILFDVLAKDVSPRKIDNALGQAKALHSAIADITHAVQHGMDGRLLSLEEVLSTPALHSLAAPHALVRVFRILSPLLKTASELGHQGFYGSPRSTGPYVPLYSEFFIDFGGDDAEIRRKKRWP